MNFIEKLRPFSHILLQDTKINREREWHQQSYNIHNRENTPTTNSINIPKDTQESHSHLCINKSMSYYSQNVVLRKTFLLIFCFAFVMSSAAHKHKEMKHKHEEMKPMPGGYHFVDPTDQDVQEAGDFAVKAICQENPSYSFTKSIKELEKKSHNSDDGEISIVVLRASKQVVGT